LEKRVLLAGSVGLAFLIGVVVGLAAGRGGPISSVPNWSASAAIADATTGGRYRLSPPNEHDLGITAGAGPARGTLASAATGGPYRLSPPNEHDTEGHTYVTPEPAYRVSPPNETDPGQ
jgi:hypothetical protein